MTEKPKIDSELRSKLNNSGFQRGLTWRTEKIQAVAEARHKGISEKEIFRELKRSGLTDSTANTIMKDAFYCDASEEKINEEIEKPQIQQEIEKEKQDFSSELGFYSFIKSGHYEELSFSELKKKVNDEVKNERLKNSWIKLIEKEEEKQCSKEVKEESATVEKMIIDSDLVYGAKQP